MISTFCFSKALSILDTSLVTVIGYSSFEKQSKARDGVWLIDKIENLLALEVVTSLGLQAQSVTSSTNKTLIFFNM